MDVQDVNESKMRVYNRKGELEDVDFNKIYNRLYSLSLIQPKLNHVNVHEIAQKTIASMKDRMRTSEIDELSAEISISLISTQLEYDKFATRIAVSNLHKNTSPLFSETMSVLKEIINPEMLEFIEKYKTILDGMVDYSRDYKYSYFGLKTLMQTYLLTKDNTIMERPQQMILRVACGILYKSVLENIENGQDIEQAFQCIKETYYLMSNKYFTHATPTLFNSGCKKNSMISCFLLQMKDDSVKGIYKTLAECADIQSSVGGIGVHVYNIRPRGSKIKSSGRESNGIVPMLKVFESTSRYIDQGRRRPGVQAIYLTPWHGDIMEFLELPLDGGKEENRARDLFYALWIPDEFMRRVKNDEDWYLMDVNVCPKLITTYGDEWTQSYNDYIEQGLYMTKLPARDVWNKIIHCQIEKGLPYLLFSDAVNRCNPQSNLGLIKSSNLCTEVTLYTSEKETATCVLASIKASKLLTKNMTINYDLLERIVDRIVRNLDALIDVNKYPSEESRLSSMKHRPLGIGIQDLAALFIKMRLPYCSEEARKVNRDLFEGLYYYALKSSNTLAKEKGRYESFDGSPYSKGILQYHFWKESPSDRFDWQTLINDIKENGLRNSTLLALMPTATTAQILRSFESFEPISNNIFSRRVLAGEFMVVNKYLVKDLENLGLWNKQMKDTILSHNGSIQSIQTIPKDIRELYKTVWEVGMKGYIQMCRDRAPFICQSQSMNIYVSTPSPNVLFNIYMYAWELGLKTGSYYTRSRGKADAQKVTVPLDILNKQRKSVVCTDEVCTVCSS